MDAGILLRHVANRQGDRIGLMLFRDVVHQVVKPAAGVVAVRRMMEVLVDAKSEGVFPSYAALMAALWLHQNRRSLVLLFTDLNDPQLAANLVEVMPSISRKHLLVVISLTDVLLDKVADGAAANSRELFRAIAARKLTSERQMRTRELQRAGAMVLQANSESLSVNLINTYLSIKTRQLLEASAPPSAAGGGLAGMRKIYASSAANSMAATRILNQYGMVGSLIWLNPPSIHPASTSKLDVPMMMSTSLGRMART